MQRRRQRYRTFTLLDGQLESRGCVVAAIRAPAANILPARGLSRLVLAEDVSRNVVPCFDFSSCYVRVNQPARNADLEFLVGHPRNRYQCAPTRRQKRNVLRVPQALILSNLHQALRRPHFKRQLVLDRLLERSVRLASFSGKSPTSKIATIVFCHATRTSVTHFFTAICDTAPARKTRSTTAFGF